LLTAVTGAYKGKTIRAVTNLMVNRADIDYTLDSMRQVRTALLGEGHCWECVS
jgi:hypothetical protein